jgi:hypothetical protein
MSNAPAANRAADRDHRSPKLRVLRGFSTWNGPFICSTVVSLTSSSASRCLSLLSTLVLSTRTCKGFAGVCAPVLFHSIRLKEADESRHQRLIATATGCDGPGPGPGPGGLVRELSLILENQPSDEDTRSLCQTLLQMPDIRSLTVVHERDDVSNHAALQQAIRGFASLRVITLREARFDLGFRGALGWNVDVSTTFFHNFLRTVLTIHANLEGIHMCTLLPLHPLLYVKIREGTPNLRAITFTAGIDSGLGGLFAKPTPWVSGQSGCLENLTIYKCHGVHAGSLVRNILGGTYGTRLKEVKVIASGEDTPDTRPFPDPVVMSVERWTWDHLSPREASAISRIPVRDLSLTAIFNDAFLQLPTLLADGLSNPDGSKVVAFRGLERLRLSPKLALSEALLDPLSAIGRAYKELEEACVRRGIRLSLDAIVWRPCYNHRCWHVG